MRPPPWWTLPSAAAAPVLLFAGWTVAGERQPDGYNGVNDTISELAANGAADRWIMNVTLLAVGLCYVVTAAGLRPVPVTGRAILAIGGIATMLVTLFPQPEAGPSDAHGVTASIACLSVAIWPAGAVLVGRPTGVPVSSLVWALRPPVALAVTGFLLVLVGWFALELQSRGSWIGLSERIAAGTQACWPTVVVLATRRVARRSTAVADVR
ncbi:DUF998 domain-containing protein [Micromonospora sp. NPDC003197]